MTVKHWNTGAAAMRFRLKNKKKKGIIMENKTIQVTVMGGVVVDVKNLPEGWDLQIIDKDNEKN
jgi:archaellum component FlaG (FlaF/FlaG flagellin family)